MAKIRIIYVCFFFVFCFNHNNLFASYLRLQEIYTREIGVRELTNRNDGVRVEMYLRHVGLGKGKPYCSAFVAYCLSEAGIKHTVNAWSPTSENRRNFIYRNGVFIRNARPGDVFTIFYRRLKRIGHTGFFDKMFNENSIVTVEGNTNDAGSREGNGVYKKIRPLRVVHSISRWE